MTNGIDTLLNRTNLAVSFDEFLQDVQSKFTSIGKVENYSPINEGYEDANIILNTSSGKYVLKIFFAERNLKNINSYIKILRECKNVGVQTTEILTDFNEGLGLFENSGVKTYYIITKFFEGKNFQNTTPTIDGYTLLDGISVPGFNIYGMSIDTITKTFSFRIVKSDFESPNPTCRDVIAYLKFKNAAGDFLPDVPTNAVEICYSDFVIPDVDITIGDCNRNHPTNTVFSDDWAWF